LLKATVSFVMSVHPSSQSAMEGFSWYLIFEIFTNMCKERSSLKPENNNGCFTWRSICFYKNISLNSAYNEKWFWQNCTEKSVAFEIYIKKYGGARQATCNAAHALCILAEATHKHSEYFLYWVPPPTATIVSRTRLSITIYVHLLCYFKQLHQVRNHTHCKQDCC
jgi:hypothetical protein